MENDVIYLDYNASTPCDPRVVEAMEPYFTEVYANPASRSHRPGQAAFTALENARGTVAASIGARMASEIVFTSGATEANNLAILGSARARVARGRHLVTQATEHPSVIEVLRALQYDGWTLSEIGVDAGGRVRLDELDAVLSDETALVSVMLANNETGTVQKIREIADLVHARGSILHCDAAQGVGKIRVDVDDLSVDLLSLSGHKAYGPKGIGALYVRKTAPPLKLDSLLHGGGHEGGIRSGTPNLHGAVGLARALEICGVELDTESPRIAALRDRLEASVTAAVEHATVNGSSSHRLPGTSNISFPGIEGNALLASLPDLALSSGSACTSSHPEASPVLLAMGVKPELARASLRISVGRFTTEEEIVRAASRICEEVVRLRNLKRGRRR
ncbi:MAG: cysteine desulfurase [Acidobacteria bacterium]|nr:cysteine desulfurase [Acidobacteriota bacterium]